MVALFSLVFTQVASGQTMVTSIVDSPKEIYASPTTGDVTLFFHSVVQFPGTVRVQQFSGGAPLNIVPGATPTSSTVGDLFTTNGTPSILDFYDGGNTVSILTSDGTTLLASGIPSVSTTVPSKLSTLGPTITGSGTIGNVDSIATSTMAGTATFTAFIANKTGTTTGNLQFFNGTNSLTIQPLTPPTGAYTPSLPSGANDTVATLAAPQTLSNKTLVSPLITNSAGGSIHFPGAPATGSDSVVQQSGAGVYYADTSSSTTAYTVTIPNYAGNSFGSWLFFKPNNTNTGAATLTVNSLTPVSIVKFWNQALVAGDLAAGVAYLVFFNGTQFAILATTQKINIPDVNFTMYSNSDPTRVVAFSALPLTTGATRTLLLPDANGIIVTGGENIVSSAMSVMLDTTAGSVQHLTLTANTTISSVNSGRAGQRLTLIVDNTSGSYSLMYPSNMKGGGAPVASKTFVQSFVYESIHGLWAAESAGESY